MQTIEEQTRDVAYLKFNVRSCGDVVNAGKKSIKGAFTNSVDQDETPQYAASHRLCGIRHVKHIFGNGEQY